MALVAGALGERDFSTDAPPALDRDRARGDRGRLARGPSAHPTPPPDAPTTPTGPRAALARPLDCPAMGMARKAGGLLALLSTLALAPPALVGCVSPPRASELLAVGFRTPEQTFATFQTAVRADEPDLQLRCFSAGFVAENRLSKLSWREFWEQETRRQPLLRKGIADARADGAPERRGDRAQLVAESHGRRMRIAFVLDDFAEVWAGAEPLVDEEVRFRDRVGIQQAGDGSRWLYGQVRLPTRAPEGLLPITELRLGREWKIDGIEVLDEASSSSSGPARERP